jgi:DNA-binding transcriptional MerR regulator
MTIDQLAADGGTTTRRVRSLQTLGLLPHPELHGRTGHYGPEHQARLATILRLQAQGFSLESLGVLFRALHAGQSLARVLGVDAEAPGTSGALAAMDATGDAAELYGFAQLQPSSDGRRRGERPLLWVVPTTMCEEREAEAS